jgi:acetate kinase
VKRYIGSMLMVLGGCDALVFTGGIGRNSHVVRARVLQGTAELGFVMDEEKSRTQRATAQNPVVDITAPSSKVKILVIRTFEELMMARQCANVVLTERQKR